MTITNLPSYPQQYISTQYHLPSQAHPHSHSHSHSHVHPAHPHAHHPSAHHSYGHHTHAAHVHPQSHMLAGPIRSEPVTRKRPKYTRSKTGCLTCRVKKIKCDETKPTCTRCSHGQRECTWPENVPSRKKPATKKQSEQSEDRTPTLSPESASPASSSAPPTARDGSPARKSPLDSLNAPESAVPGRRTHSEPNTAAASPVVSPIDTSSTALRRPSLPQNIHSTSSVPYASSNSQQLRAQHYPAGTPPNVSPASYHPSPASSHDYSSFNGSPVSNGHSGHNGHNGHHNGHNGHNGHTGHSGHGGQNGQAASMHRHEVPSIQTSQSRLSELAVDTAHNLGSWHAPPLMNSSVDPIEPFFRTVQERNLIRHYVNRSSEIQLSVPSEVNPFLAVNLPLVVYYPLGTDPATEALRLALLGIAATHQSFLFSKSGMSEAADETMATAKSIRLAAMQCLTTALATSRGAESNAALSASISITLIDILAGGQNWTDNLSLAKTLVRSRGAPATVLACDPPRLGGGVLVAPARLLLENLAVYENFACLASGDAPDLLSADHSLWWFIETNSFHVQSVEKIFGVSRDLMPLIARVLTCISRLSKFSAASLDEDEQKVVPSWVDDAQTLLDEVAGWTPAANPTLIPARVERGNAIYLKLLKILLKKEALKISGTDARIQSLAESIIELCGYNAERGMGVHLLWPVIIAGSELGCKHYPRILEVLEFLRKQCCYEIDTAERILSEVWSRRNAQSVRADWRSVISDLNLKILIN